VAASESNIAQKTDLDPILFLFHELLVADDKNLED
jgi:hypothetical protein